MSIYEELLRKEQSELLLFTQEEQELAVRIKMSQSKVRLLNALIRGGDSALVVSSGISQACLMIFRGNKEKWLASQDVYRCLKEIGFDLDKYKNPQATILTTVLRQAKKKRLAMKTVKGKRLFTLSE
jgi:hypothetical protein